MRRWWHALFGHGKMSVWYDVWEASEQLYRRHGTCNCGKVSYLYRWMATSGWQDDRWTMKMMGER